MILQPPAPHAGVLGQNDRDLTQDSSRSVNTGRPSGAIGQVSLMPRRRPMEFHAPPGFTLSVRQSVRYVL